MDKTSITSHNQSGGITAHTVHMDQEPPPSAKGWKWVERWQWIAGITAGLFAIGGAWWTLAGGKAMQKPNQPANDQSSTNITSYNQSGGITAHTVNVDPNPRKMDDSVRNQLNELTKGKKKVTVTAVMGDGEALNFATEIKDYLTSRGLPVSGVDQAIYNGPVKGQSVKEKPNDELELIIGNKN